MVPRQTMKCEYCGTEVILAQDGFSLSIRKQGVCPKCGNPVGEDAWFCRCGQVLAKDVEHLKQIQKKYLFNQEKLRNLMPEIRGKIEPDEFIYYLFYYKGLLGNKYFVATDKRLITFDKWGQYWESLLNDIVSVSNPQYQSYGEYGCRYLLVVQTFKEQTLLDFGQESAYDFHRALCAALDDYTRQTKYIGALICSLKIP
jgi:hypothetical protein